MDIRKIPGNRWALATGVAGVAVVLVLAGMIVARTSDNGSAGTTDAAVQIGSVQTACQQWLVQGGPLAHLPGSCAEMATWMTDYMHQHGLGPADMWGDPSRMLAMCQRWIGSGSGTPGTASDPPACSSMVTWMSAHMSTWSGRTGWQGWMMHGPMMGDPGRGT